MRLAGMPGFVMPAIDWRRARRDPLVIGMVVSILFHLVALAMRFAPPTPIRLAPFDSQIEVVLLNARTETRPSKADVLAQVNQEGGGDRDKGRAKSPLPAEARIQDGNDVVQQRKRIQELEAQQRQLMTAAKGPPVAIDQKKEPQQASPASGADQEEVTQVIARLQAQIDRQIADYNKRPKRLTYGINAVGVTYAQYVDEWATRIERIGTDRYPPEARGKLYDSLIITVEIDKFGNVVDVIVNKKSRFDALNKAIKQIVHAGAPYPRFSPEMAKEGDILQIVRTWTFTNGALTTEAVR